MDLKSYFNKEGIKISISDKDMKQLSEFKELTRKQRNLRKVGSREYYSLRHMLGYLNWAEMVVLLGGREAGKSYSVTDFFCRQYKYHHIPFYWIRLTEEQARKLLQNNAMKLVDPDLRRKYKLDLVTNANIVYNVTKRSKPDKDGKTRILEKEVFAQVYDLSTAYKDKGSLFDKDFLSNPTMRYNIAVDEFEREPGERKTFDIVYSLATQLENLVRSTHERLRVFFLGNCLEDASDILASLNFIPEEFGIFKLKNKRCVIENIEPSEAYLKRRAKSIANILMPDNASFKTNKMDSDKSLIDKKTLRSPMWLIKFTKDKQKWYTMWDDGIIKRYNNECIKRSKVIAMRPYLDEIYAPEDMNMVFQQFYNRSLHYHSMMDFKCFQNDLTLLKSPR